MGNNRRSNAHGARGTGARGTGTRPGARLGQDDWQAQVAAAEPSGADAFADGGTHMNGGAHMAGTNASTPPPTASAPPLPPEQGRSPFGVGVATPAEQATVRRIGVKAVAWSAVFVALLAAAAIAWAPASVNSPAVARGVLRLPGYAWEWAVRYPWLAAAYPWLAGGALAVLVVAATYLLGWYRAAGVIRDAEAGDPVALTYLKEGPRLGSVEWWWTTPPVRPKSEGRKVTRVGVIMVFAALALIAIAVLMIVLDWGRPRGRALGPAFPAAMLLSAVPVIALAAWCLAFTARPSAGKVKAAGVMRWALVGVGLLGLAVVGWLSVNGVGAGGAGAGAGGSPTTIGGLCAVMVAFYAMTLRFLAAARTFATIALERYITVPTPRRRINAELRRMGESEQQQPLDGTNAAGDRVNRRRERRKALQVAGYVVLFVVLVAVGSWVKARTGIAIGIDTGIM